MSRKFLTALDLAKNELQNAAVQNLAGAPASPVKGQLYFNTSDNTLYWCENNVGPVWISARGGGTGFPGFGSSTATITFGLSKSDGVAGTTARADHTHGTPTHDASAHSTIPLSSLAVPSGPVSFNGQLITSVGTPSASTDATNKQYVDNLTAGLAWKDSVRIASTANLGLTGLTAIDGVTPIANDRILVKNQSAPAQNGIYTAAAGAWTRSTDSDIEAELVNATVFVSEGTTLGDTAWVMTTNAPITVGTTALTWVQFGAGQVYTAGAGLTGTTTFDVIGDTSIVVTADLVTRGALTGDVTAPQASNATTIANNAVTNAKAADMAANSIKGNITGAPADPIDMTVAQAKTLLAYTKTDVGLGNVDNTSDANAPVSTAQQTALNLKADKTISIGVTAPLTGGGDLSANRTIGVSTFTSGASGVVPASGGAPTSYLSADGTWKTVTVPNEVIVSTTDPIGTSPEAELWYDSDAVPVPVARKYVANVGGSTTVVVNHGFGTQDINVQVRRVASPFDFVDCDMEATDASNVTLRFAVAPAASEYRVVVMG